MPPFNCCSETNYSDVSAHNETDATNPGSDRIKVALSVAVLLLMPGNLLVIVVYVRRLTSSIRLYMFGLAVSDTAICFNAIVLGGAFSRGPIPPWLEQAMVYVYDVALFYSVFVLTMISVERYLSVRSPTHFTFSGRRAQIIMTALAGAAIISSAFYMIGRRVSFLRDAAHIYVSVLLAAAFATMVAMYAMMAHLMRLRIRRLRTIGAASPPVGGATPTVSAPTTVSVVVPSPLRAVVIKSQQKTAKGMRVLLVVTVVFIACWSPLCLAVCGLRVPSVLLYLFIINSVINPFIYSFMSSDFRQDVRRLFRTVI